MQIDIQKEWITTCKIGSIIHVEKLINAKANINAIDEDGNNGLMWAVKNNNVQLAELLITNGININYKDEYDTSALIIASEFGYVESVEQLQTHNAILHRTPMWRTRAFRHLYYESHIDILQLYFRHNIRPHELSDDCSLQDERDVDGLFHRLIQREELKVLEVIQKDDNIYSNYKLQHDVSQLKYAYHYEKLEVMRLQLVHNADPNYCSYNEATLIYYCCVLSSSASQREMLAQLQEFRAETDTVHRGKPLLHTAAASNNASVQISILTHTTANIDQQDNLQETALMQVVEQDCLNTLQILLQRKPNIYLTNPNNQTILMVAATKTHATMLNILLQHAMDILQ